MVAIDADGHVEESTTMFSFIEEAYYPRRPLALGFERDTALGDNNALWLIDGKVYPKMAGKGGFIFRTPTLMEYARRKPTSIPAQEMTDMGARLKDLDRAGINRQVVYPTLFLTTTADDVELEAALLRAYNNFMADACSKSGGRVKFAALVAIRNVNESIRELRRAKRLGAVSVMVLGVAWDRSLGDKTLYPFYEEAAHLNMPVCVHFGWGSPAVTSAFEWHESFCSAVIPVLMGFHSVMSAGVLDAVPKLRMAFLESGSEWVPYVIHQLKRRLRNGKDPAEYFREGRVYVASEADEDINGLVSCIGEDAIVIASDYPHHDPSTEEDMVRAIMERDDLPIRVREKILSDNPQRLYNLTSV